MSRGLAACAIVLAACAGNGARQPAGQGGACEESPLALVQEKSAIVEAAGAALAVEVADTPRTRGRGLQHRRCDVTGLLLVAEAADEPMPIWMCEVEVPLDLAFLHAGRVVHVEEAVPPCAAPCGGCPTYGENVVVDAVLETPAGSFPLQVGDTVVVR